MFFSTHQRPHRGSTSALPELHRGRDHWAIHIQDVSGLNLEAILTLLEFPGQATAIDLHPLAAADSCQGRFEVGRDALDADLQLAGGELADDCKSGHAGRPFDLVTVTGRDEGLRVIRPVLAQHVVAPLAKPGGLPKRLVVEDHQPAFVAGSAA